MVVITQEQFDAYSDLSMELGICFCMCGCQNDGVPAASLLGMKVPGLCPSCRTAKKGHERIATVAMYDAMRNPYVEDAPSDRPSRVRRAISRFVSAEKKQEAAEYVERVGEQSGPTIARLVGKDALTDAQAEAALRAKAADERSASTLHDRLVAEHYKVGVKVDLISLTVPDFIIDGFYLTDGVVMQVWRPTEGELAGYVVIKHDVGEGVTNYGVQPPGGKYRGWYPQLVAKMIANPVKARMDYERTVQAA